jgi:hypothetical protein
MKQKSTPVLAPSAINELAVSAGTVAIVPPPPAAPSSVTPVLPEESHETAMKAALESDRKRELRQYIPSPEPTDEAKRVAAFDKMTMEAARRSAEMARDRSLKMAEPVPSASIALPKQLIIRLNVTAPGESRQIIHEALVRAGGTIVDEPAAITESIRARIPADKLSELNKQLEKIGKLIEFPPDTTRTGTVDVTILW